jgi:hypothetical protein
MNTWKLGQDIKSKTLFTEVIYFISGIRLFKTLFFGSLQGKTLMISLDKTHDKF